MEHLARQHARCQQRCLSFFSHCAPVAGHGSQIKIRHFCSVQVAPGVVAARPVEFSRCIVLSQSVRFYSVINIIILLTKLH